MPLPGHYINRQVRNSRELQALESIQEKRSRKEWPFPPAVLDVLPVTRVLTGHEKTNRLYVLLKLPENHALRKLLTVCSHGCERGKGPPAFASTTARAHCTWSVCLEGCSRFFDCFEFTSPIMLITVLGENP